MKEKGNYLNNEETCTEQNCNMIDGISNNTVFPEPPSVPVPEIKPLDKVKEPPRRKRSRELER